jgi:hypothetical protein
LTKKQSKLGEKINKVVTTRRDKVYTEKHFDHESNKYIDVEIGRGWEIVKELSLTGEGLRLWEQMNTPKEETMSVTDGYRNELFNR